MMDGIPMAHLNPFRMACCGFFCGALRTITKRMGGDRKGEGRCSCFMVESTSKLGGFWFLILLWRKFYEGNFLEAAQEGLSEIRRKVVRFYVCAILLIPS